MSALRNGNRRTTNQLEGKMTDIVDRAKAALEGVTEGVWLHYENPCGCYSVNDIAEHIRNVADARFIARAHNLMPELVAEVERAREAIEKVQAMALNPVRIMDAGRLIGPVVMPSEILKALAATDE